MSRQVADKTVEIADNFTKTPTNEPTNPPTRKKRGADRQPTKQANPPTTKAEGKKCRQVADKTGKSADNFTEKPTNEPTF